MDEAKFGTASEQLCRNVLTRSGSQSRLQAEKYGTNSRRSYVRALPCTCGRQHITHVNVYNQPTLMLCVELLHLFPSVTSHLALDEDEIVLQDHLPNGLRQKASHGSSKINFHDEKNILRALYMLLH